MVFIEKNKSVESSWGPHLNRLSVSFISIYLCLAAEWHMVPLYIQEPLVVSNSAAATDVISYKYILSH